MVQLSGVSRFSCTNCRHVPVAGPPRLLIFCSLLFRLWTSNLEERVGKGEDGAKQGPVCQRGPLLCRLRAKTRDLVIVICPHKWPRRTLAHTVLVFLTSLTRPLLSPRQIDLKSLSDIVLDSPLTVGMNRREGLWRKKQCRERV